MVEHNEKVGGSLRREGQMDQFHNALVESQLSDLGLNGAKFMWFNCRHDEGFI